VDWSSQIQQRDYHSEEVGPKPWHSPVSDLSVQNFHDIDKGGLRYYMIDK
jgi:hypothetical protein